MLLDTGPVYALLDARDGRYADATRLLEELESQNALIICAYPAALEVHRLMLSRETVDVKRVHDLINDVQEVFGVEMPTLEDAEIALESLKRYNDQRISLTDATIAAMSQRLRYEVLTFDQRHRHFELMGARVYRGG